MCRSAMASPTAWSVDGKLVPSGVRSSHSRARKPPGMWGRGRSGVGSAGGGSGRTAAHGHGGVGAQCGGWGSSSSEAGGRLTSQRHCARGDRFRHPHQPRTERRRAQRAQRRGLRLKRLGGARERRSLAKYGPFVGVVPPMRRAQPTFAAAAVQPGDSTHSAISQPGELADHRVAQGHAQRGGRDGDARDEHSAIYSDCACCECSQKRKKR